MRNTRWKKLLRDIYQTRGRIAMMAVALGVSLFGVGAILSAYSILNREISRNYAGTNPASATVEIDETDDALIRAVRQQPGIAEAEARTTVLARFQVQSGVWQPILLFVVKDFTAMKIGTFKREEGAWPPPRQSMLLERTASKLFGKKTGDSIVVKTPNGTEHEVLISGTTHDPGLAPSWQEHLGYGYITPETLVWLGEQGTLDELKIIVSRDGNDEKKITARALELASWLKSQGHTIKDIQVPPPGKHPHQGIMVALLVMLFIFSVLALVLSAILTATMIAGIMAKEVRQIGVMKAVGARDGQVAGMYITLVLLISGAAVALGLPLGIKAGKGLSEVVSGFLNFTLYSQSIPWWVFSIQIMAGVIVPLMLAMIPISGISKLTVREAISDFGVKQKSFVSTRPNPFLFMFRNVDRTLLLAIRNTFRRRGKLLLTLGLLTAAGSMFMTALNVKAGWNRNLADSFASRQYDFEIRLSRPESAEKCTSLIREIPGVKTAEAWGFAPASGAQHDGFDLNHTYPDGGHGSLTLKGVPDGSTLVRFPVLSGRWLKQGDTDAVVLNQLAVAQLLNPSVGATVSLTVNGKLRTWRVAGIVKELGPASAYVTEKSFEERVTVPGYATSLRVVTADKTLEERARVIHGIEEALKSANIGISMVIADAEFRDAISDHIFILIFSLVAMAGLMTVVGMLGLTSTMSTNVLERTREFGVMRAIGGTPATVFRNIISEAVFIGMLSIVGAVALSMPLSYAVGKLIGTLTFKTPLPMEISFHGIVIWIGIVVIGSVVSSAFPAWRASRMTVRETLVYE